VREIKTIRANLFPAAWPAIEPWSTFKFDRGTHGIRTHLPQSSQAFAIDTWGTIKSCADRDAALDALAAHLGIPSKGEWKVYFEWTDPYNKAYLREHRLTQVDVVLRNDASLVFVESKFTEQSAGSCSRPLPSKEGGGYAECNGNHEFQSNPVRHALFHHFGIVPDLRRCALDREGIRYWDHIPNVLGIPNDRDYRPCPFTSGFYQFMRNLVLVHLVAKRNGLVPFFLLAYADSPHLATAQFVRSPEWQVILDHAAKGPVRATALSYQNVIEIISACFPAEPLWTDLREWVVRKIERVTSRV